MKHIKLRTNLNAAVLVAGTIMAAGAQAYTHEGGFHMMDDYGSGWMGGHGGVWVMILLVAVVAGLVGWIIGKKRK
ncbi:hypothetical protein [Marinobacterium sedimentorum]|uniref:hypothetical protein n=1 Tax=Marinobacterium sedimentorum TaxID=2927804 RepID=UPI0020C6A6F4|nr:hypothetical protein [Marinobacterium sedimentorum]MCP8688252.1 hypothetical protein [Marinobacterium sedimentorum]